MSPISAIYPICVSVSGAGYACQSILDAEAGISSVSLHCVAVDKRIDPGAHRPTLPAWGHSIGYRCFSEKSLARMTEWRYLRSLSRGDVAYIWPATETETFRRAKATGCIVVAENINTHQKTSKAILDREYRRLGLVPSHGISERDGEIESEKLAYTDYVFSPSPGVTQSLLDAAVPEGRIIPCSYGLSVSELFDVDELDRAQDERDFVAVFVGRIGIRKGVHLLLDYWVKSGVRGTLKLVGNIEASARHLVEPYLGRPDIQHVGYRADLRPVYREADVFLFPSLEEGSPLVTYQALGAGLPSIVSPMGSGGVVRDGQDGVVVAPHDEEGWVGALRSLANDDGLRASFGRNARSNGENYVWDKVGRSRFMELRRRIDMERGASR